jgi:hypothetical protein
MRFINKFLKIGTPYFLITLILIIIYTILSKLTHQRVGDGSEYYALFYAWSDTLRPWMTATSFDSYELLFSQSEITGLVSREQLVNAFPSLRLGDSADFNHFWFYSFLAFIASKLLTIIGVQHGVHQSFLALHFLLLFCTAIVAFYLYNWRGLFAVVLMTVSSPILWYLDKVHTKLFTYCTVLLAVLFFFNKNMFATVFMLAIASTQNPSFALIAFVPFFYRIVILKNEKISLNEQMLLIGIVFIVSIHPMYYFFRFGVITPQLLAGGANFGANLSTFYIWLIDPDLGLLTNWLLGMLLTLIAMIFLLERKKRLLTEIIFSAFLLLFSSFSLIFMPILRRQT